MSKPGKPCTNAVADKHDCSKAAWYFNRIGLILNVYGETFTFIEDLAEGGYDLPKGCIIDMVKYTMLITPITYVYWNPNGVVLSSDIRVKQVCIGKS